MSKHHLPKSVERAITELSKLPGIGAKTASRLVFYLLSRPQERSVELGEALKSLRVGLASCEICWNIAETNPCSICADDERDPQLVMVVEEPLDVVALERTDWTGRYHVLGGVISPIQGIGPTDLRIRELLDRIEAPDPGITEIVLATDPSLEGEATALYLQRQIEALVKAGRTSKKLKITRLARGLPVGGDLEYADELTLTRALEGRKEY